MRVRLASALMDEGYSDAPSYIYFSIYIHLGNRLQSKMCAPAYIYIFTMEFPYKAPKAPKNPAPSYIYFLTISKIIDFAPPYSNDFFRPHKTKQRLQLFLPVPIFDHCDELGGPASSRHCT